MTFSNDPSLVSDMNKAVMRALPSNAAYTVHPLRHGLTATGHNAVMTVMWGFEDTTGLAVARFLSPGSGTEFSVSFDPSGDEVTTVASMAIDAFKRL